MDTSCVCVSAIVNKAALNIGAHVSFWITVLFFFFIWFIPRKGIAGSYGSSLLSSFSETSILFSTVAAPIYSYTNSVCC